MSLCFFASFFVSMEGLAEATGKPPVDFSGHWMLADLSYVKMPEWNTDKYTEQTLEKVKYYETYFDALRDDPAEVACLLKGMPWTMLLRARDYPMEIYQTRDRVMVMVEIYDTYRSIHLDRTDFPENYPASGNGFSIAHWEGNTLVIETRGLTETNHVAQVHRSEQAYIVERWTLKEDPRFGEVLDIAITIDDPEVFTEPVTAHQVQKRAPEGTVVGGYNCSETLWDKYVQRREQTILKKVSN